MKLKNGFPLLIAIAMIFPLAPGAAQAAQQKNAASPPPKMEPAAISMPYRLTYTLTEINGSTRVGSQRYTIVLDGNNQYNKTAHLRLGSRIPIATTKSTQSEITYIDIGMKIDATLRRVANGLHLVTNITQSAIDSQKSSTLGPVIRQVSFETTTLLNANKPTVIGNVDLPGTARTLQIQVEATKLQ